MTGQGEDVEADGVALMRGRRTLLGRTLAHMLDPMVDALHRRVLALEGLASSLQADLEVQRSKFEQTVRSMEEASEAREARLTQRIEKLEADVLNALNQRLSEQSEHLIVRQEARMEELVNSISDARSTLLAAQEKHAHDSSERAQRTEAHVQERFDQIAAELLNLLRIANTESLRSSLPDQHVSTAVLEAGGPLPPVSPVPYDTPNHGRALQEEVVQKSYRFTHTPSVAQAAEYDGINLWHCLEVEVSRALTLEMVEQVRSAGRVVTS